MREIMLTSLVFDLVSCPICHDLSIGIPVLTCPSLLAKAKLQIDAKAGSTNTSWIQTIVKVTCEIYAGNIDFALFHVYNMQELQMQSLPTDSYMNFRFVPVGGV